MFIHFHVVEFAIMGVQMANFGGQVPGMHSAMALAFWILRPLSNSWLMLLI